MLANGQCINNGNKKRHARLFFLSICFSLSLYPFNLFVAQRQSTLLYCHSGRCFFSLCSFIRPNLCMDCTTLHECVSIKKRKIFMWLRLFSSDLDDALSLLINCFNSSISFFLAIGRVHISHCFRSACVFLHTVLFFRSLPFIFLVICYAHIFCSC